MKWICLLLCVLMLSGCAQSAPLEPSAAATNSPASETAATENAQQPPKEFDPIQQIIDQMSLEQRVGQLFLVYCDDEVAAIDAMTYHLGGFVLFADSFENQTPDIIRYKLANYQAAADLPLLIAVDEEGGTVTRISRFKAFRNSRFSSARDAYASGGLAQALAVEEEKCDLLGSLTINVNLGPVCDIATDPDAFMYQRSLGQDADITAQHISGTVQLMNALQIGSVLKHFPGYGNNADTHTGIAVDSRSLEQLEGSDLVPFAAGIRAGCGAIMVSHTIVEALDDQYPASLSPAVHRYLREAMGFEGVIITDDLYMEAISTQYGAGEAAVLAVLAGNDLLCCTDYVPQYEAVLDAVLDGRIDMVTLDNAVRNVLEWKAQLGLI